MDLPVIPPQALVFLVAMLLPTVPVSILFYSIWLLLIHHGAEPIWTRSLFQMESLHIWIRIRAGDTTGLDEATAAKFLRLRTYLVRAAEFWGAWLVLVLIVMYAFGWSWGQ